MLGKKIEQEIVTRERFSPPALAEHRRARHQRRARGQARRSAVRECTVFNSDIRGFTRMSERPPEAIVEMLNEYFEQMVDTIFKYEGTLDKFMGDGIMALWGAPVRTRTTPSAR